ncbi:MAG: hypothetical protein V4463_17300 [Pseudomonadota bacterium]
MSSSSSNPRSKGGPSGPRPAPNFSPLGQMYANMLKQPLPASPLDAMRMRLQSKSSGGGGSSTSSGPSGTEIGAGVGALRGGYVVQKRAREQRQALNNPASVKPGSRLDALVAMRHAKYDTTGMGMKSGISAIHMTGGNFFEAQIGKYFNLEAVQTMARAHAGTFFNPSAENLSASKGEATYWGGQLRKHATTIHGTLFPVSGKGGFNPGNIAGALAPGGLRAALTATASRSALLFPVMAGIAVTGAHTGAGALVGDMVESAQNLITGKSRRE